MSYWYCLHHNSVEPDEGCPGSERLGPYGTRADAEAALQRAKTRSDDWDHDKRWNDEQERGARGRLAEQNDLED